MPIRAKINLSKLDKTAFFDGKSGKYLDIVLWETPGDQYGNDWRVVQDLPRERRDAGEKGEIVGNGKNFGKTATPKQSPPPQQRTPTPAKRPPADVDLDAPEDSGGLPF